MGRKWAKCATARLSIWTFPVLLFWLQLFGPAASEIILVQDNSYPPYMSQTDGRPEGIYAVIIKEAQKRLEADELVLEAVPWTRATVLVENGHAQGLVGSYYKPEDRPWIRHWSVSLYDEEVSVFCRSGVARKEWTYPDDYKGLLFGNVAGYRAPGSRFFEMVEKGDIKLEEAQTTEQNLSKLVLGRIDCYVVERLATEMLIHRKNYTNVDIVGTASIEPAYIGYSDKWTGPEADTFIRDFDATLRTMKTDGTINRIIASFTNN
ncbi:Bacterial extracellular solute-binding proteins, family 3 [Roseibium album]|nr:Bacterial extracellular solute-binding proteins, family 3 [Roseibium album]